MCAHCLPKKIKNKLCRIRKEYTPLQKWKKKKKRKMNHKQLLFPGGIIIIVSRKSSFLKHRGQEEEHGRKSDGTTCTATSPNPIVLNSLFPTFDNVLHAQNVFFVHALRAFA